jgi:hypothetical protein
MKKWNSSGLFLYEKCQANKFYMKKIFSFLLTTLLLQQALSQTETFDIATYNAPAGFSKITRQGVVTYTDIDTATGKFCVISIYASTRGTGDAAKDFAREWKELAVTPFKADANPPTETESTSDGWKAVTGASAIKESGVDCYLLLTVLSGFGKSVSVRCSMNDASYVTMIDALFKTLELHTTTTAPVTNTTTTVQPVGSKGNFGYMTYTAPAGWSEQVFADGVVFKPLDLPSKEHLAIQIMQPLTITGSLEDALRQSYDEAATMYKGTKMYFAGGANYQVTEARKSFNGWEYIRGKGSIKIQDGTQFGTEYGLEIFAIKINNRFERVAILESRTYCNSSRHFASDRLSYRNSIADLLFSLQFSDFTGGVLKPGFAKGPGIVGVWEGITQSTAVPGFRIDAYSIILFNNGQIYYGPYFPIGGLDGLDSRIPPELSRRDWKTYTYSGGIGNMKMIYADIPFRLEGERIIVTKNQTEWHFTRVKPVDGATFNGTYNMSAVNGRVPSITFTTDGRFTDNGAMKVLYHEYIDCLNAALMPGSGTYSVKDFTVTFNYSDGRKIKLAFLGTGYDKSNPSPSLLRMSNNNDPLTRQ